MARDNHEEDDDYEELAPRRGPGVGTFLAGLAIGAGLALLFAPQSGDELRRKLKRTARRAQNAAEDLAHDVKVRAQDLAQDVRHRAEDAIGEAKHELDNRISSARHVVDRRKREITRAVDAGRAAARDARESFERRIAEARGEETES